MHSASTLNLLLLNENWSLLLNICIILKSINKSINVNYKMKFCLYYFISK